jgi:hypothetical protein
MGQAARRVIEIFGIIVLMGILYGCPADDTSYTDCSRQGKPLQWDAKRGEWHCGDR